MKWGESFCTFAGVLFFLFVSTAFGQNKESSSKRFNVYSSSTYGFKVQYQGTLVRQGSDEYIIDLPASTGQANPSSKAHIFVAQQPFVYLPGTYGGRYYFNEGNTGLNASDQVQGDSVNVNGLKFARDYWAVYAEEGQWETVINCYALHAGQYYIVSLERDLAAGMPGEKVNGVTIAKQQIRARLISALRDTTDSYVRSFNQILDSFTLTK